MTSLPNSLEEAITQAQQATQAAIADGLTRLQVELNFPELKPLPVAQQFVGAFEDMGTELRVFFADPGSAALARRDWGDKPYSLRGIGELKAVIQPEEKLFLFVAPSSIEVEKVEELCTEAGDRPCVLLNPRLEDVATIGIGYAGRRLRDRFLSTIESCYFMRPLDGAVVYRAYPSPWQVWVERENGFEMVSETPQKPVGDDLDRILMRANGVDPDAPSLVAPRRGILSSLQDFLRALSQ
ncbi:DUF1995 family protein [Leptolyngbya sp. AN02str]|uniref:DUF1995 family protein n=1 Tax=Leptolyngbya sp. AN02str TaxID=3423363 RepID=UPI003D31B2A1